MAKTMKQAHLIDSRMCTDQLQAVMRDKKASGLKKTTKNMEKIRKKDNERLVIDDV